MLYCLVNSFIFFPYNIFSLGLTSASFDYTHLERPRSYYPTYSCYGEKCMVQWLDQSSTTRNQS